MKDWKNISCCLLLLSVHLSFYSFAMSYWVFFAALFLVSLTILAKKDSKIEINQGVVTALLIFTALIIRVLFQGNIYGTYFVYILLSCWLLFFIWTILFNRDRGKIKCIAGIIIFTCFVELAIGFVQLFGWLDSSNEHFRLGGSFGNPGIYAGYLGVVSPLILSLLLAYRRNKKVENLCYVLTGCLLFVIYMLAMSRSRGAWIAFGLGCVIVVSHHFSLVKRIKRLLHSTARKIAAIVCVSVIVCAGGYVIYQWKADSAFGRLLVWKVALSFPPDLYGKGIGYFEAEYGKKQAEYFASGETTEAERYVADYVTFAYNEFLEIGIEQGLVVVGLFLFLLYSAFRRRPKATSALFLGAQASVAAIIVLMCVSFPLKVPAIYLYFIFCLVVVFHAQKGKRQLPVKGLKWSLPVIALLIALAGGYNLYGHNLLREGQEQALKGRLDNGIDSYRKAERILKNSGVFHFYYGSALYQKQDYEAAIKELEISVAKSSNPSSFILLGNSYKESGQSGKAKENYLTAIRMIPGRLYPKYLLAKLFIEAKDMEEAGKWAKEILATKEKVPTTAAKEIKQEMEEFLNNNSMSNYKNVLPME